MEPFLYTAFTFLSLVLRHTGNSAFTLFAVGYSTDIMWQGHICSCSRMNDLLMLISTRHSWHSKHEYSEAACMWREQFHVDQPSKRVNIPIARILQRTHVLHIRKYRHLTCNDSYNERKLVDELLNTTSVNMYSLILQNIFFAEL
jgi:hypothetical protein